MESQNVPEMRVALESRLILSSLPTREKVRRKLSPQEDQRGKFLATYILILRGSTHNFWLHKGRGHSSYF